MEELGQAYFIEDIAAAALKLYAEQGSKKEVRRRTLRETAFIPMKTREAPGHAPAKKAPFMAPPARHAHQPRPAGAQKGPVAEPGRQQAPQHARQQAPKPGQPKQHQQHPRPAGQPSGHRPEQPSRDSGQPKPPQRPPQGGGQQSTQPKQAGGQPSGQPRQDGRPRRRRSSGNYRR